MLIGSDEHKELFCRSFIATHQQYDPRDFPWPELDQESLDRLRGIPFWSTALQVERNAGVMVSGFAESLADPLIREAVALQGYEEARHGRMLAAMVERYGLEVQTQEPAPTITERAFIDFGYEECLDSFFGFGIYRIARQIAFLPDSLTTMLGARLLGEETCATSCFSSIGSLTSACAAAGGATALQAAAARPGVRAGPDRPGQDRHEGQAGLGFSRSGRGRHLRRPHAREVLGSVSHGERVAQMASTSTMRLLQPRVLPTLASFVLEALDVWRRAGDSARTRFAR